MEALHKRSLFGGEQSIAKRSSATITLVVSNEHAGAIIGFKGATLSAIRYLLKLQSSFSDFIYRIIFSFREIFVDPPPHPPFPFVFESECWFN